MSDEEPIWRYISFLVDIYFCPSLYQRSRSGYAERQGAERVPHSTSLSMQEGTPERRLFPAPAFPSHHPTGPAARYVSLYSPYCKSKSKKSIVVSVVARLHLRSHTAITTHFAVDLRRTESREKQKVLQTRPSPVASFPDLRSPATRAANVGRSCCGAEESRD